MHKSLPRSPAARQPLIVSVRRSALLEDANAALASAGADIRRPLRVSFISEQGYEEAGIDQGGLTKEFLEEARVSAREARTADVADNGQAACSRSLQMTCFERIGLPKAQPLARTTSCSVSIALGRNQRPRLYAR